MAINFLSDQLFPSDIFLVDVSLGRIGVNTLVPRTALEVVGTIRVWSGSNTHTYVETSSGSNLGSIQGKKNSDNAVRSLALNPLGGNVGINLGAGIIPSEALQVQGSARIQADSNNFLKITTSQAATTFANSGNGIASPSMSFNTGADTRLTILGINGNVGIGTTSPEQRLHISSSGSTLMRITGGGSSIAGIDFGDSTNTDDGRIRYDNSSRYMQFVVADSERMRITSAGDTGIGVTTPRAKLDVAGGIKVADDTDSASANKVGTLRYRYVPGSPKNFSYVDMCMQTGGSSYAWVNIVQNVWN